MNRFNYIVTIHNKEDLIRSVMSALLVCSGENSHIYPVLDGCSDATESIIDELCSEFDNLPITKLYAPDVHEVLSINTALRLVPQDIEGYNIIVQDDVIMGDRNFELNVVKLYEKFDNKLGVVSFHQGANVEADHQNKTIREIDIVESCYGHGHSSSPLLPGEVVPRMVASRSPQCISTEVVRTVGLLDEKYAPFTYDDFDYSIRCLRAGLSNVVCSLKKRSDVVWGGMRTKPQPHIAAIMRRNRGYVYQDHADFIESLAQKAFMSSPEKLIFGNFDSDETAVGRHQNIQNQLRKYKSSRQVKSIFRWLKYKL